VAKLDARAFPEKVDFVTSPGQRVKKIITNMCTLEPESQGSGELVLTATLEPAPMRVDTRFLTLVDFHNIDFRIG
jgi:hypothetical protein